MSQFDALMEAIKSNDEAAALKAVAAINLSDDRPGPDSPILQALYRGMEQVPAALVAHGYAPSLIEAAAMGDAAATKERAEAGEDLTLKSPDGWTALHLAAFLGRPEATAVLLAAGADHGAVSANPTANQPLHAAIAGRGDAATIAALIAAGADASYAAGSLWTPLHLAAARGNAELCETLIAKGSPVGAKNVDGLTPADVAESRGHAAVAERLKRGSGSGSGSRGW